MLGTPDARRDVRYALILAWLATGLLGLPCDVNALISCMVSTCTLCLLIMLLTEVLVGAEVTLGAVCNN